MLKVETLSNNKKNVYAFMVFFLNYYMLCYVIIIIFLGGMLYWGDLVHEIPM